jgi:hypothetical protein
VNFGVIGDVLVAKTEGIIPAWMFLRALWRLDSAGSSGQRQ